MTSFQDRFDLVFFGFLFVSGIASYCKALLCCPKLDPCSSLHPVISYVVCRELRGGRYKATSRQLHVPSLRYDTRSLLVRSLWRKSSERNPHFEFLSPAPRCLTALYHVTQSLSYPHILLALSHAYDAWLVENEIIIPLVRLGASHWVASLLRVIASVLLVQFRRSWPYWRGLPLLKRIRPFLLESGAEALQTGAPHAAKLLQTMEFKLMENWFAISSNQFLDALLSVQQHTCWLCQKENATGTTKRFRNRLEISCLCENPECSHFKCFSTKSCTTHRVANHCKWLMRSFCKI